MKNIHKSIRAELKAQGIEIKLNREFEEYRVNFIRGKESTAYYTNDLDDAVNTARRMALKPEPNFEAEALRICNAANVAPDKNLVSYIKLTLQVTYQVGRKNGIKEFNEELKKNG